MKLDLLRSADGADFKKSLATWLLTCLVIHCMSTPTDNPDQHMFAAIGEKRMAATRTMPSPYQHWFVYQRILSKSTLGRGSLS